MWEDGSEFDKDLSNIIIIDDINGDIYMYIMYSDGVFFIWDMVEVNIVKGYKFMVIIDYL